MLIETQTCENEPRTYSSSTIGYFNPVWTSNLVLMTDQIQRHYKTYSPYVEYAVTFQTKLTTRRDKFRLEQLLISLQQDFWHFNKRINYECYGKASHRKPHRYSLLILPVIEGTAFSSEGDRTLHYHLGIGNVPKAYNEIDFHRIIRSNWTKTKFGIDDIDFKSADPDWSGYITKEVEKGNVDCIDWRNASIPHEALHI